MGNGPAKESIPSVSTLFDVVEVFPDGPLYLLDEHEELRGQLYQIAIATHLTPHQQVQCFVSLFGIEKYGWNFEAAGFNDLFYMARLTKADLMLFHILSKPLQEKILTAGLILNSDAAIQNLNKTRPPPRFQAAREAIKAIMAFRADYEKQLAAQKPPGFKALPPVVQTQSHIAPNPFIPGSTLPGTAAAVYVTQQQPPQPVIPPQAFHPGPAGVPSQNSQSPTQLYQTHQKVLQQQAPSPQPAPVQQYHPVPAPTQPAPSQYHHQPNPEPPAYIPVQVPVQMAAQPSHVPQQELKKEKSSRHKSKSKKSSRKTASTQPPAPAPVLEMEQPTALTKCMMCQTPMTIEEATRHDCRFATKQAPPPPVVEKKPVPVEQQNTSSSSSSWFGNLFSSKAVPAPVAEKQPEPEPEKQPLVPEEPKDIFKETFGSESEEDRDLNVSMLLMSSLGASGISSRQTVSFNFTPEDHEAISMLEELGHSREEAEQAYLACDRDEMAAMRYLAEH